MQALANFPPSYDAEVNNHPTLGDAPSCTLAQGYHRQISPKACHRDPRLLRESQNDPENDVHRRHSSSLLGEQYSSPHQIHPCHNL